MPRKLDEVTIARMKNAYISGQCPSYESVAQTFKVGKATIKKYAKEGNWPELKQAAGQVQTEALARYVPAVGRDDPPLDIEKILRMSILSLAEAIPNAPIRSQEGALVAVGKAIECYFKHCPPTQEWFVDMLLSYPDFSPNEFARLLRQKYEKKVAGQ